jgi:hypothetical protein
MIFQFFNFMIELIFSPKWFYGKDIVIDIVSIFVLILIAYFSFKYYHLSYKNKKYLLLSSSFFVMGLSFLFKIVTNFTLYYSTIHTQQLGLFVLTYKVFHSSDILFSIGFLIHRILMLIGLFILYLVYSKTNKVDILIFTYFIFILTYFSRSEFYVFHLTSLLFLIIITYQYWQNYKKVKHSNNLWLFYSFILIIVSQLIFVFMGFNHTFYAIAEIIQLLGYISLLITFIKVLKDGKKKRTK